MLKVSWHSSLDHIFQKFELINRRCFAGECEEFELVLENDLRLLEPFLLYTRLPARFRLTRRAALRIVVRLRLPLPVCALRFTLPACFVGCEILSHGGTPGGRGGGFFVVTCLYFRLL